MVFSALTPSTTFYIEAGLSPMATYTVWEEPSGYFAKTQSGQITYSDAKSSNVINNCSNALTDGGIIHLVAGDYYTDGVEWNLATNDVFLRGEGRKTKVIVNSGAESSAIVVRAEGVRIEHLMITSSIEKTLGAGIAITTGAEVGHTKIEDILITNHYEGLRVDGEASWITCKDIMVLESYYKHYALNNASFVWMENCNSHNTQSRAVNYSLHIMNAYSCYFERCEWLGSVQYGVISNPSTGVTNAWLYFVDCASEVWSDELGAGYPEGYCWVFSDALGGSNRGIYITKCWAVSGLIGMRLENVSDGQITDLTCHGNQYTGLELMGTATLQVTIKGGHYTENSRNVDNTYSGIKIYAGTSNWMVCNAFFYGYGVFGAGASVKQKYGIEIETGASDWFIISDNIFRNLGTGAILDGSTGTNTTITDNVS